MVAVLSGNRNFEGRINSDVRANYLASPPLVVAYALAGRIDIDLLQRAARHRRATASRSTCATSGRRQQEVDETVRRGAAPGDVPARSTPTSSPATSAGTASPVPEGDPYAWDPDSTYVQQPPYFDGHAGASRRRSRTSRGARVPGACSATASPPTTSRRPARSRPTSPAGQYLIEHGVAPKDFNSYGARRGNHEVMVRGTFANIRLRNHLVPEIEGGFTAPPARRRADVDLRRGDAYQAEGVPLVVLAGKEYGTGSSRDWAAKGPRLLGVRAVIAESFERIHRSNLVGMGVLPLEFRRRPSAETLGLTGREAVRHRRAWRRRVASGFAAGARGDGARRGARTARPINFQARLRLDTPQEVAVLPPRRHPALRAAPARRRGLRTKSPAPWRETTRGEERELMEIAGALAPGSGPTPSNPSRHV